MRSRLRPVIHTRDCLTHSCLTHAVLPPATSMHTALCCYLERACASDFQHGARSIKLQHVCYCAAGSAPLCGMVQMVHCIIQFSCFIFSMQHHDFMCYDI